MAGYNTGSFHAIIYWPWPPKVEVEVQDYHVMALGVESLENLQVQGEEGMNIKGWMDKVGTSREGSM